MGHDIALYSLKRIDLDVQDQGNDMDDSVDVMNRQAENGSWEGRAFRICFCVMWGICSYSSLGQRSNQSLFNGCTLCGVERHTSGADIVTYTVPYFSIHSGLRYFAFIDPPDPWSLLQMPCRGSRFARHFQLDMVRT